MSAKKKISAYIKLQLPAGKANPSPPVGPALGQHGVNIMGFCKDFNAKSAPLGDTIIPVVITVYADRSYSFVMKSPPASVLIKKACGLPSSAKKPGSGSKEPNKTKVGQAHLGSDPRDRPREDQGHERRRTSRRPRAASPVRPRSMGVDVA